jgi:hypothetical protein
MTEETPSLTDLPASSAPPSRERVILLANASMRARRRPRTVLLVYLYEAVVGLVIATPLSAYVRSVYGSHPDGDAPLFADGAADLVAFVTDGRHAISSMLSQGGLVLFIAYVVSVVPLALLLMSVAHTTADLRAPSLRQLWPRVVPSIPPLLALLGMMTIIEGVLAAVAIFAGGKIGGAFSDSSDARADSISAVATLLLLLLPAAAGVVHDLARAAVVRFRQTSLSALKMGARTFAKSPGRLLWSWLWRSGASLIPVIAAAVLSTRVTARGGLPLFALFMLHQAVILTRVALRASWLARAMRAVDSSFHVVSQRS